MLIAGRSIEESSEGAFPTTDANSGNYGRPDLTESEQYCLAADLLAAKVA
jgi:hypothetical protein